VKGIVEPADAAQAVDIGAQVIFVSNHGGRQLDGAIAAIQALPAIVDRVGQRAEVVLDGGVRRGTHVLKALCLGARAVSVGRPWVYGLASGGENGLEGALRTLRSETEISMELLGQTSARELDRSYVSMPEQWRELYEPA
jgi:isopentenyl diphosphate isomerase/L-lactate dehydrogenase-like FMN-dependent dehydrogenase